MKTGDSLQIKPSFDTTLGMGGRRSPLPRRSKTKGRNHENDCNF